MIFRACDNEWELAKEALPLLQCLMSAAPGTVSLGELVTAAGIPLADVTAVVSDLINGQAATVVQGDRR
ncbi:hypothetical protein [Streptomyces sp. NPDC005374]|uniref:hypothetical protein n=1 Tax=Streptomyces sp. NPDC005374 TaxID=3364713 RepID=UPI0036D0ACC9